MALTPNLRGALFMSLSMAGFTFNDTVVKFLSSELNMGQIMFIRGMIASVLIFLLARHRGALRPLRTIFDRWVALRVLGEIGGTITFVIGLAHIPLANTSAILQALPLAVTMGAAVFLGEPVGWRRWTAILVGFFGVMLIVRPGLEGFSPYSLLIVLTVLFAAMRDIATRKVDPSVPSLFLSAVTAPAVALSGLLIVVPLGGWQPVEASHLGYLVGAAVLLLVGYQFVIMAMREGEISFIAPFRYTSFLWAVLLGFLVFEEIPDVWMMCGGALIVLSGLYTLYRERITHRAVVAAPAPSRHNA